MKHLKELAENVKEEIVRERGDCRCEQLRDARNLEERLLMNALCVVAFYKQIDKLKESATKARTQKKLVNLSRIISEKDIELTNSSDAYKNEVKKAIGERKLVLRSSTDSSVSLDIRAQLKETLHCAYCNEQYYLPKDYSKRL